MKRTFVFALRTDGIALWSILGSKEGLKYGVRLGNDEGTTDGG